MEPLVNVQNTGGTISRRDLVVAAGIFLLLLSLVPAISTLSAQFTYDDWYLQDEGTILYTAYRSSLGELPHLDTQYFYSGGFELLLGIVFNLFGTTLAVARWTLGVNMGATASLVYLLSTRLSIDRAIAAGFAVIGTALCYSMNFHCYPAWYGGTFLLMAVFLLWQGLRFPRRRTTLFVLTGVCLGVASSLKQTTGLYGLLGFILSCLIICGKRSPTDLPTKKTLGLKTQLGSLMAVPVLIWLFFVILIRSQLTLLNLTMFLATPTILAAFAVRGTGLAWGNETRSEQFVANAKELLVPAVLGVGIGFLPLVVIYTAAGGIEHLIGDSFVNIRQAFEGRYSEFKFVDEEATSNLFVFVRWLTLFVLPVVITLVGFSVSIRNYGRGEKYELLMVVSVLIAVSYFTLYPIAIRMYVLYLMPMVLLPAAYFTEATLKRFIKSPAIRLSIVGILFMSFVVLYLGTRSLAGDLGKIFNRDIRVLDGGRGNALVPQQTNRYLQPVLHYLESRPTHESVVYLDIFDKLLAFVTQRRVLFDYLQRHYSTAITPNDLREMKSLVEHQHIDIIVVGKNFLPNPKSGLSLLDYLATDYALVLNNETHLIYQRIRH